MVKYVCIVRAYDRKRFGRIEHVREHMRTYWKKQ